jgi:hypothetical protein
MEYVHGVELSERESFFIGQIVALWGSLEYEIFCQTVMSFEGDESQLPKEMNNVNFSKVLELWNERVVAVALGKRKKVLNDAYSAISYYQESRNALVHGMWHWETNDPQTIIATRVSKNQIISTRFTADILERFAMELRKINFRIRHPGGIFDYAKEFTKTGSHVSRKWVAAVTNNPVADELFLADILGKKRARRSPKVAGASSSKAKG